MLVRCRMLFLDHRRLHRGLCCLSFRASSNTFSAVEMHCCTHPSFMKALCALFRICCSRRIFPQRSARIFAAILPNSCKTEMGRMSFTLSVHEPSSFLFGIIVITDFLQDGS